MSRSGLRTLGGARSGTSSVGGVESAELSGPRLSGRPDLEGGGGLASEGTSCERRWWGAHAQARSAGRL